MAVKSYSYSKEGDKNLSPHFKVREFASISSDGIVWSDTVKIDTRLIDMLEKLHTILGCANDGYIRITSGYRTPEHDRYKTVGGSGKGKHVDGMAADVICKANGKIISSKIVSCIAADLGFMGIANITSSYEAIHLDVRTGNKYWGDETRGYSSIWYFSNKTDFYSYYGLTKAEVDKYRVGKVNSTTQTQTTTKVEPQIQTTGQSGAKPNVTKWLDIKDNQIVELQKVLNAKGARLTVDGYAGKNTYNAVKKYTIRLNDRGPLVKWVQTRLTQLGYNCTADGIAGAKTMATISKFQTAKKLGTGYLGGTDWYYLVSPVIK